MRGVRELGGAAFAINLAGWHPQATLFDVTKVILIFSAQHSKRSHGRGCGGGRDGIGGVVAAGEPASGTTMHSAMGKGYQERWGDNWLLKHIVNRLHNELRLLFETGRWKLRRKCNRRDVVEGEQKESEGKGMTEGERGLTTAMRAMN